MAFMEMASRAFSFLEKAGFRLVRRDRTRLEYDSELACITVGWDTRSGELTVSFRYRRNDQRPPEPFILEDVLAVQRPGGCERAGPLQVAQETKLEPFLQQLADEMQRYAQPAMAADRMFLHRLRVDREARAQQNMHQMELRQIRSAVDAAWRQRDLPKVAALLTPIETHLSESEKKKLKYARKHQK